MNDALRQHRRCPVNVIVRIRFDAKGEFEARCATDLSMGGLQMVLDHQLEEGHRVDLEFRPLQDKGRIESVAVVRWCRPHGEHFAAGLEFAEMDEDSRTSFEEAMERIEERKKPGSIKCLSEATLETESIEAFAASNGAELVDGRLLVGTDEAFEPGSQLLVEVSLPDDDTPFRADSVVCACEKAGDGYEVEVRFWYLDEPSRHFIEQVNGVLNPDGSSARYHGINEEAWFAQGDRMEESPERLVQKAVVRKWPIRQHIGIGMAGLGGMAAAALAIFVLFRGPAMEGIPNSVAAAGPPPADPPAVVLPDRPKPLVVKPVVAAPVQSEPPGEGVILSIRSLPGPGEKVEITADVDLSGRFQTEVLKGPSRFLMDIRGVKRGPELQAMGRVGSRIKRFRVGRHPDMVRVVLDMTTSHEVLVSHQGRRIVMSTL